MTRWKYCFSKMSQQNAQGTIRDVGKMAGNVQKIAEQRTTGKTFRTYNVRNMNVQTLSHR